MNIEITPEASLTIIDMWEEVLKVERRHGSGSPEAFKTHRSFGAVMKSMTGLGGKVMKDGDLSLICQNEYITYGVNFDHRDITWSVNS